MDHPQIIEFIEETTVGCLGDQHVPMANAMSRCTYTLPDGSSRIGPGCMLMLPESTWVGVGSEVQAGGYRWVVTEVRVPEDDNGAVYLKRLNPENSE